MPLTSLWPVGQVVHPVAPLTVFDGMYPGLHLMQADDELAPLRGLCSHLSHGEHAY